MDSGSYSNVRRGAMPTPSTSSNSSYKANVNRTKTRKWVEAKIQSYDGDDWGNDYDDEYDDGDDQQHVQEPLPPVPRPTDSRQSGQTTHQLPSLRAFPMPPASLPSIAAARTPGPPPLRNPSGPLPLRVQTQPMAPSTRAPPYVTESAHPTGATSEVNRFPGPHSAGPASTPAQYPPRKSSMGPAEVLNVDRINATKYEPLPALTSGRRPSADQRSASPGDASTLATKPLPMVRPSDIYKRMGEENDKGRLALTSGSTSFNNPPTFAQSSHIPSHPSSHSTSEEPSRRTNYGNNDVLESTRSRKGTLASVAEHHYQDGIGEISANSWTGQPPIIREPIVSDIEPSFSQGGPTDEIKADLVKTRRFSTSPQLPSLSRLSGFGDDFFSNSSGFSTPLSDGQRSPIKQTNASTAAAPIGDAKENPAYSSEDLTVDAKPEVTKEKPEEIGQSSVFSNTRPLLPGSWISESTTAPLPYDQTPFQEKPEAKSLGGFASLRTYNVSPMAESDTQQAADITSLPSSIDSSDTVPNPNTTNQPGAGQFSSAGEQPDDILALRSGEHPHAFNKFTLPSYTHPSPVVGDPSVQMRTSPTAGPDFSPTAPLDPRRAHAGQHDNVLPQSQQRYATSSTIDTISPEKESDKLREEIIKSLSPAPISPDLTSLPNRSVSDLEPTPGSLTRESTYLADVYDDYLSPAEERDPHMIGQMTEEPSHTLTLSIGRDTGPTHKVQDASATQPAPLNPAKSAASDYVVKQRRFSWQQGFEEEAPSSGPTRTPAVISGQILSEKDEREAGSELNTTKDIITPVTDSPRIESGVIGTVSPQVSQVTSPLSENTSMALIRPPSPNFPIYTRRPDLASSEANTTRLSLADEKEMVLIGHVQTTDSSASEQHPAYDRAPEEESDGLSSVPTAPGAPSAHMMADPTPFREILNLGTCEERVRKFEETREQFYAGDSGLSNWLIYIQGQHDGVDFTAGDNTESLLSKPGGQPMPTGVQGTSQFTHNSGTAAPHSRRASISNVHQFIAGQSSGFGGSGNQVGTKSKELFHAAGVFGNKGVKSGMKLFNKGKNKLRERAAGDKAKF